MAKLIPLKMSPDEAAIAVKGWEDYLALLDAQSERLEQRKANLRRLIAEAKAKGAQREMGKPQKAPKGLPETLELLASMEGKPRQRRNGEGLRARIVAHLRHNLQGLGVTELAKLMEAAPSSIYLSLQRLQKQRNVINENRIWKWREPVHDRDHQTISGPEAGTSGPVKTGA